MTENLDGLRAMAMAGGLYARDPKQVRQANVLVLAYIGDTVYDLIVRTYLSSHYKTSASALHKQAIEFVSAHAQCAALHRIADQLTEEETAVFRRGRNAKSASVPKNADVAEYRTATGFETLLGYLYLSGQDERLTKIGQMILSDNEENE